jgi:N12 class adenine-specific DNA methylase/adenine-specific DNA methylase
MPRKQQLLTDLYRAGLAEVTQQVEHWQQFLISAGLNYRYPFDAQLLIHLQRPDATAVLTMEQWNRSFHRWVRAGSRGIALFDPTGQTTKIRYVFDISDTEEGRNPREVPLWTVRQEYCETLVKTLMNRFGGSPDGTTLETAIQGAVWAQLEERSEAIASDYGAALGQEATPEQVESLQTLITASVSYGVSARCGLPVEKLFPDSAFSDLVQFQEPSVANVLGAATSALMEEQLVELARTTRALQKQPAILAQKEKTDDNKAETQLTIDEFERSDHHEPDLYRRERRPIAQPDLAQGAGDGTGEIRPVAEELSDEPQTGNLSQSDDHRTAEPAPGGDSADRQLAGGEADEPDGSGGRNQREPERAGTPDLGGTDERGETPGGGAGDTRPDPDLTHKSPEQNGLESDLEPVFSSSNYVIHNRNLGEGGPKSKFRANLEAIYLLKKLEEDGRQATPEEQDILANYVGWGGLSDAFDEGKESWTSEYAELKAALTTEEYAAARASTLNAHYTSPTVIQAIYQAVGNLGFQTGNILEPSMGVGNFFGLLPEKMRQCSLYGVELDSITGRIAQRLYPQANIQVKGFEDTDFQRNFFDLVVGNVPFGNYQVSDPEYDSLGFSIHNYFLAKSLDRVRPGGVVAVVTSSYTMDSRDPTVRRYLAQRADLLGAIRLPNNAFRANAGTDVVADILFLQKRSEPRVGEPDWVFQGVTPEGYPVNQYFVDHPSMILGTLTEESTQYGKQTCVCVPIPGADLAQQLGEAISHIHGEITPYLAPAEQENQPNQVIPATPDVRNFSYTVVEGQIYYRENSQMRLCKLSPSKAERVKGMIGLRDCVRELLTAQRDDRPDGDIAALQRELNRRYDSFTADYGLINSRTNSTAFSEDSGYYLLCSLEKLDDNRQLERKADLFTRRTIQPHVPVTHVDTATEALALSLSEKAKVDMAYMAQLTGKPEEWLEQELSGVIFRDLGEDSPQQIALAFYDITTHPFVPADEYLSGNVRKKLILAEFLAEHLPEAQAEQIRTNVEALRKVQPQELSASEISVQLGATWLPAEIVEQFIYETLHTPYYLRHKIKVHYASHTSEWNVEGKSVDSTNIHAISTYGTQRISAYTILEQTLNLREVKIFDYHEVDGKRKAVLNRQQTTIAQGKQEALRQAFQNWIWNDPNRRETLVKKYNETFNAIRPRTYDGSHLNFVGMNPEIKLRPHQVNAIARVIYGGNTLLAHEVGAGKTFEIVASAMESKRLGLCSKSLIVVPNHLTEQWASEFLQLYPAANILVSTKADFETKNRKKFCAKIATGDFDAIIIGHSQFEKIPLSMGRQIAQLERERDDILAGIAETKAQSGDRWTVKAMERSRKSIEVKLKKLHDQTDKDDVVTFEELGIDRLFVDEAHLFKNLYYFSKMQNVGGIAQTEAKKSADLFLKCRYLDEITGGKGVVFATGTPVSNSMVELYTMQRYLQYAALERLGLHHFDAWASTFGETVTAIELAPEGYTFSRR